jgi:hypothetical protein
LLHARVQGHARADPQTCAPMVRRALGCARGWRVRHLACRTAGLEPALARDERAGSCGSAGGGAPAGAAPGVAGRLAGQEPGRAATHVARPGRDLGADSAAPGDPGSESPDQGVGDDVLEIAAARGAG